MCVQILNDGMLLLMLYDPLEFIDAMKEQIKYSKTQSFFDTFAYSIHRTIKNATKVFMYEATNYWWLIN